MIAYGGERKALFDSGLADVAVYVLVGLAALAAVAYLAMSWHIKRGGK